MRRACIRTFLDKVNALPTWARLHLLSRKRVLQDASQQPSEGAQHRLREWKEMGDRGHVSALNAGCGLLVATRNHAQCYHGSERIAQLAYGPYQLVQGTTALSCIQMLGSL